jgi:hypothetical protein
LNSAQRGALGLRLLTLSVLRFSLIYRIQGIRHTRSTFSLRTLKLVMSADPLLVNAGV